MDKKRILITGASGFIGSWAVEKALALGYETWAGIRKTSSRSYLQDERVHLLELDFSDKERLTEQLRSITQKEGRFHYIVHVAGITKARSKSDFDKVNYEHTRNLVETIIAMDLVPDSFIFMSTLGAIGMGDEKNYTPLQLNATLNPNTAYGKSKLKAEQFIKSIPAFPYVILRPTGVYGPRDKDYLILIKAVKKGLSVGAGFRRQVLSFIYIDDLIEVIFACIKKNIHRKEYFVADGDLYTDAEFNKLIQRSLCKKRVVRLKIPLPLVKCAAFCSEKMAALFGKVTTFNTDKYHIMKQRNWACDISDLQKDVDFRASHPLSKGIEKTIEWYRQQNML